MGKHIAPFELLTLILLASTKVDLLPLPTSSSASLRGVDCEICKFIVLFIHDAIASNKTFEDVYPTAVKVCVPLLDSRNISGEYMCPGIISSYGPVVQIVATQILLDPDTVCRDLNFCTSNNTAHQRVHTGFQDHKQSARMLSEAPLAKGIYSDGDKVASFVNSSKERSGKLINFVQLSDIHLDPLYSEGSPTDCGLYFCCRSWYNGTGSAGYYGSYGCDIPKVTLDLVLDKVLSLSPAPEFIIYTGDNSPHDVWNETDSTQTQASKLVVDYLSDRLSSLDVSIYPAMGNHESWPESEYTGTLKEYQELTQYLSTIWEEWVELTPSAKQSIAEGGYYSLPVRNGLRIISFNSDYGYSYNFYALLNFKNEHYKHQWDWLMEELEKAENNHEKVLLIGHIPPGDTDNNADYGQRYLNITKRFKDTIVGHLFGHTHKDHFQLIQDEAGVYGVVMVSPSITTFPHTNPSFRVYSLDQDTMQLLSYTQYYLNISSANELHKQGRDKEVEFEVSYTSKEEYLLDDLSAESWHQLVKRFSMDDSLVAKYNYNRKVKSDEKDKICDSKCRQDCLCDVNNIISIDAIICHL